MEDRFSGAKTLYDHVMGRGGLDPAKLEAAGYNLKDLKEELPKQLFRKGGRAIDELAEELSARPDAQQSNRFQYIREPDASEHHTDQLLRLLREHYIVDGLDLVDKEMKRQEEAHYTEQLYEQIRQANPGLSEGEIDRAVQELIDRHSEAGSREGGSRPAPDSIEALREIGDEPISDEGEPQGPGGGDDLSDIPFRHRQPVGSVTPDISGLERPPGFGQPLRPGERVPTMGGAERDTGDTERPRFETALAFDRVDADRVKAGKDPILGQESRADPQVWKAAADMLTADPKAAEKLVDTLIRNPRGTTAEERALLLYERLALRNEHGRVINEYLAATGKNSTADQATIDRLEIREKELAARVDATDSAAKLSGSEVGRALRFQRVLAREDFSLAGLTAELRAAKGKPLTEAELRMVKEYEEKIKDLQEKLAAAEKAGTAKPGEPSDADFEVARTIAAWRSKVAEVKESSAPWHVRAWKGSVDVLNIPRSIMSSIDFPLLRQGLIAAYTHPISTAKSIPEMFHSAFSERAAERAQYDILHRPNAPFYKLAGLEITGSGSLTMHEEGFVSRLVNKIPVVGHITRGSERSYQTVLNRIRADVFDSMAGNLAAGGRMTSAEGKVIANYVNVMTGRGSLGPAERAASVLNQVFFAPKWAVSRFQYLLGQPLYSNFGENAPRARRLVAKEYGKMLVGVGVVAGAAALAGFDLEKDPRSSDFGKLKIGNTRLDLLGGLASALRFLSQAATLSTKTPSGHIQPLRFSQSNFPADNPIFGHDDFASVTGRMIRGKLAPAPSATINLMTGRDVVGQPVTPATAAGSVASPLFARDVYDAVQDLGMPRGLGLSLLGLLGMGMQTYDADRRLRGLR